jgi:Transposase DDE domain group 1
VRLARIRLSDKSSRLHPRHVVPKPAQAYEPEVPIRARIFAIACGYEDGNDLDHLRNDPAFKLACGRLPDTDRDLCSQPTLSRLENAPRLREAIRLSYAWARGILMAKSHLTLVSPTTENRTVTPLRRPNAELRTRSMWGCALKSKPASAPARSTILAKPAVENGEPRAPDRQRG